MVELSEEEAKNMLENIEKRIRKAYKIMKFAITIKGIGTLKIGPKTFKDIIIIILGYDNIRRDLRRYFKDHGFWQEED